MMLIDTCFSKFYIDYDKMIKVDCDILKPLVADSLGLEVNETRCMGIKFSNMEHQQDIPVLDKYLILIVFMFELVLSKTFEFISLKPSQESMNNKLSILQAMHDCTKDK